MNNFTDWGYNVASQTDILPGRGFTGYSLPRQAGEWLPWFNMYNMPARLSHSGGNGRLYDPVVGRFLSPDPVIQDPLATQEYNRYSYCLNNPLKYSDPTGYIKQNVDENSIDWAYLDYLNNRFGGGGTAYSSYIQGIGTSSGSANFLNYVSNTNGSGFQTVQHYRLQSAFAGVGNDLQLKDVRLVPSYTETVWVGGAAKGEGITVPYVLGGMENSAQALSHYFNGNGTPVTLGNNTISALVLSDGFQTRHQRIISGKTTSLTGSFSVNLRGNVFHVGKTNVDYSISCANGNCTVTYDMFVRDGFWDPDFIDEYFMGKLFGEPLFQPDGPGPNLERFGGTPYPYNPVRGTYTFPNPGY